MFHSLYECFVRVEFNAFHMFQFTHPNVSVDSTRSDVKYANTHNVSKINTKV